MSVESPDRFEPSPEQQSKQGKSASKRIAVFVFLGAGIVFTLVSMSILNSEDGFNASKAPVNLFVASRGAESISLPKPKPPEPEPVPPQPEPKPAPKPRKVRPAYVPIPKVSEARKQEQMKRLMAASAPTTIQAFDSLNMAGGNSGNAQRATQSDSDTLAEVSRLLAGSPVPQQEVGGDMPFMPQQSGGGQSDPNGWARKDAFTKQALPEEYSQHVRTAPRSPLELKSGTLPLCPHLRPQFRFARKHDCTSLRERLGHSNGALPPYPTRLAVDRDIRQSDFLRSKPRPRHVE